MRNFDFLVNRKTLNLKQLGGLSATFFCVFENTRYGFDYLDYAGAGVGFGVTAKHIAFNFSLGDGSNAVSIGSGLSTSNLSVSGGATYTFFMETLTNNFRKQFSAVNRTVKQKAQGRVAFVASKNYSGSIVK